MTSEPEQLRAVLTEALECVARHFPENDLFRKRMARIIEPELERKALFGSERLLAIERAAHDWADAVIASEDNDEESAEYLNAAHGLFVALGRSRPA